MTPQELDDIQKQAEFDRLMTAANVHRRRSDYSQAEQLVRKALDIRPDDPEAREFAADMLFARGELDEAAAEYKRIFESDKTRTSAEEKYARAIVQISEGKRQQDLLQDMLEHPRKFRVPARSPVVAAILSGIPGLGQVYCNQLVRGVAMFLVAALSWLIFYALAPAMPDYSNFGDRMRDAISATDRINYFMRNLGPGAILFLCIAIFTQIYAIVDAAVIAEKTKKTEQEAG